MKVVLLGGPSPILSREGRREGKAERSSQMMSPILVRQGAQDQPHRGVGSTGLASL